jgi:hypothetical protein
VVTAPKNEQSTKDTVRFSAKGSVSDVLLSWYPGGLRETETERQCDCMLAWRERDRVTCFSSSHKRVSASGDGRGVIAQSFFWVLFFGFGFGYGFGFGAMARLRDS